MKKLGLLILTIVLLSGTSIAQKGFKKGNGGMMYKIYTKSKGRQIKLDNVVFLKLKYTNSKDSMIFDSWANNNEISFKVEKSEFKGDLNEGLLKLKAGDSAQFFINADSLFEKVFKQDLPEEIEKGSMLHFYVKVGRVSTEEELAAEAKAEAEKTLGEEEKGIDLYIKENNLLATKTSSGLRFVSLTKTDGALPVTGKKVTVHYTGRLLDGTKFDSSVDRNEPFQFTLGVGQVIKGWDEGIALLKKGEKGMLIIPSKLGYGARGAGKVIKPNSTLIFEVELLDFEQ